MNAARGCTKAPPYSLRRTLIGEPAGIGGMSGANALDQVSGQLVPCETVCPGTAIQIMSRSKCARTLSRCPWLLDTVVPPLKTNTKSPRSVRFTSRT
jgi:hypothetical protein